MRGEKERKGRRTEEIEREGESKKHSRKMRGRRKS